LAFQKYTNIITAKFNRWIALGLIFFFAAMTTVYVYNVVKINALLIEIGSLEQQNNDLRFENEVLNTQLNRLQSPDRIIKIAIEKFKMEKPTEPPKQLP